MFRDAAEMMDSNPTDCHRSHVTAFRWEGDEPVLTERVLSTGEERRLGIDPLDLFVSEARRCVGKRDGTMCCSEPQSRMHHCRSCDPFPVPECRFQPRCNGTMCDGTVCGDDHVVYLALFAENPKVGMTRAERLRERGMEQGADMIVPLQTHPSRRQAREAEQNLSKQKGIPQSMPVQTAVGCLGDDAGELAAEKWEAMSSSLETCGDPLVLDGYPLHGTVSTPRVMPTPGKHRGGLIGCKGRLAVYRDELGMLKVLDMKDLVSRFIGTAPSRCAQSTLF